jgi:hypothetical protein
MKRTYIKPTIAFNPSVYLPSKDNGFPLLAFAGGALLGYAAVRAATKAVNSITEDFSATKSGRLNPVDYKVKL